MSPATKQKEAYDGSTPLENARHEAFCHEYLIDSDGQRAYIAAGYSEKGAGQSAYRLLNHADFEDLQVRLAYLQAELNASRRKTAEDIIQELEYVGFSRVTDYTSWNESGMAFHKNSEDLPPGVAAAIESVQVEEKAIGKEGDESMVLKTKVKQHNKLKALELLMKNKAMLTEKVEHSLDDDLEGRLTAALKRMQEGKDK
jgi:phage terminase small subunit